MTAVIGNALPLSVCVTATFVVDTKRPAQREVERPNFQRDKEMGYPIPSGEDDHLMLMHVSMPLPLASEMPSS